MEASDPFYENHVSCPSGFDKVKIHSMCEEMQTLVGSKCVVLGKIPFHPEYYLQKVVQIKAKSYKRIPIPNALYRQYGIIWGHDYESMTRQYVDYMPKKLEIERV